MAGKTISTSTLGLRFMQNAHRAKQLKETEFERADVKDDGQWEVAQEVRNAWGTGSGSLSQSVDHETSYLPFLFPSLTDASEQPESSAMAQRPKGRRVFDKKGREVIENTEPEPVADPSLKEETQTSSSNKSKLHPRPISISESSGRLLSGLPSKNAKTAKQAVYDNTGVGTDLRPPKTDYLVPSAQPRPNTFLKPSGVDDPADTNPHEEASNSNLQGDVDVIAGARNKRQRSTNDHRDGDGAKRKKKKKKIVD